MSINRRTAIAVRSIGVASAAAALALGVAGSAFACSIVDFSSSISCDHETGNGNLVVHDTDGTRPVTITVKSDSGDQIAQQVFNDKGDDFTLSVPWKSGTHYVVTASVQGRIDNEVVMKGSSTVPDEACAAPTTPASPTPSETPTTSAPTTSAPTTEAPTPSASTTSPAADVADTNVPSPAGGTSDLAETGGGSNTGMIAGIAAVLVAAGGGTVFMLRRRNPAGRH